MLERLKNYFEGKTVIPPGVAAVTTLAVALAMHKEARAQAVNLCPQIPGAVCQVDNNLLVSDLPRGDAFNPDNLCRINDWDVENCLKGFKAGTKGNVLTFPVYDNEVMVTEYFHPHINDWGALISPYVSRPEAAAYPTGTKVPLRPAATPTSGGEIAALPAVTPGERAEPTPLRSNDWIGYMVGPTLVLFGIGYLTLRGHLQYNSSGSSENDGSAYNPSRGSKPDTPVVPGVRVATREETLALRQKVMYEQRNAASRKAADDWAARQPPSQYLERQRQFEREIQAIRSAPTRVEELLKFHHDQTVAKNEREERLEKSGDKGRQYFE